MNYSSKGNQSADTVDYRECRILTVFFFFVCFSRLSIIHFSPWCSNMRYPWFKMMMPRCQYIIFKIKTVTDCPDAFNKKTTDLKIRFKCLHYLFLVWLLSVTGWSILVSEVIKRMCSDGRKELLGALPKCIHHNYVEPGNALTRSASLSHIALLPHGDCGGWFTVYREALLRLFRYCCYVM